MAREYAPRNRKPAKKRGGVPGWIWMIAGLSLGLAVAAFVYVSRPTQAPLRGTSAASEDGFEPETRNATTSSKEEKRKHSRGDKAEAAESGDKVAIPPKEKSRFTFYELLPSQEVLVPSQAPAKPTSQTATATAASTQVAASKDPSRERQRRLPDMRRLLRVQSTRTPAGRSKRTMYVRPARPCSTRSTSTPL